MSYGDRKWKKGSVGIGQQNFREALRHRPPHLQTLDGEGVYLERKRLKSKYRGVYWTQRRNPNGEWMEGRWQVEMELHGVKHYGGRFREENEIEAAKAYDALAKSLLGFNAQLNFPSGDDDWTTGNNGKG